VDSNIGSAVGANVVLIGAELPTFGGDALQLLLGRRVGVPDLHQHSLFANGSTMVLLDDVLALLASLKSAQRSSVISCPCET
jgi:hypothetical protein